MFFFKNPVLCEQDSKKKNFEEENRKQVYKEVDRHLTWIKQKEAKKRIKHQSLGRENLVGRGGKRGMTK
jgi:hypothetical protein